MDQNMASLETPGTTMADLEQLARTSFLDIVNAANSSDPPLDHQQRIMLYRNWIAARPGAIGDSFAAWYNLGVLYSQQHDYRSAVVAYQQALAHKPGFNAAVINLGLALEASGDTEAAQRAWCSGLQPDCERTALFNQQGRLLEKLGKLDEAETALRRSLLIDPEQPDVIQHWVHIRQKMCAWPILATDIPGLSETQLLASCGPLGSLAITDDPALQCAIAAGWIERKTIACSPQLAPAAGYRHQKLRIGYLSSDFCKHALSYLVAGLFESHSRMQFEIFGYCAGSDDHSDIRRRIIQSFDHFRSLSELDDGQAARLIRQDEIDILVDLNGLTAGSRIQILRWRPAPLQATYLGFVGPVPLPELDALLCDDFVIPLEHAASYLPRPHAIAGIYQANDSHRQVTQGLTRALAGLPETGFVFCCFCGHFKITQIMFEAWVSILIQVPGSVLWMTEDNAWSRQSMLRAAGERGLDPARILFAPRCAPELYMARLGLADLFLDTFPYTSGTVASDAIRMQLPMVTLPGRSFASRMAARLLTLYGADDGVAETLDDYIGKAVAWGGSPDRYAAYHAKFSEQRWNMTYGDVGGFTQSFEDSLVALHAAGQKRPPVECPPVERRPVELATRSL